MLIRNPTVWHTRVQNVDALLTAVGARGTEVYRLATVCQVGLDPPRISISPNPEYPICSAIDETGYFGLHFMAEEQSRLVARFYTLQRDTPDKLGVLGLRNETTEHGTPLLLDCIEALEVRVEQAMNVGDHRTYVGRVVERRPGTLATKPPHRFGGSTPRARRWLKRVACETGAYDLLMRARHRVRPVDMIEQGTRRQLPTESQAAATVGICLVGCGWWGGVHGLILKQQGSRIRRYFTSRTPEHARDFARRFDGRAFERLEDALADPGVTAMVIALPHDVQAGVAERALRAGKHVLIEKPIAIALEPAQRLLQAAEESGRLLAVAEEYRLSPLVAAVQRALRADLIGRVTLVHISAAGSHRPAQDWKNRRARMGGGVLLDVGVHYVDILRSWFGEPDLVWGTYPPHLNPDFEGEDSAVAVLRFPDGPVATIALSWSSYRNARAPQIEIVGERGSLELRFDRPFLLQVAPLGRAHWSNRLRERLPWRVARRIAPWVPRNRLTRIAVPNRDLIGSEALIDDFIRAITSGAAPATSGLDGLRDLEVVLAAYAAAETRAPLPFAPV